MKRKKEELKKRKELFPKFKFLASLSFIKKKSICLPQVKSFPKCFLDAWGNINNILIKDLKPHDIIT